MFTRLISLKVEGSVMLGDHEYRSLNFYVCLGGMRTPQPLGVLSKIYVKIVSAGVIFPPPALLRKLGRIFVHCINSLWSTPVVVLLKQLQNVVSYFMEDLFSSRSFVAIYVSLG